MNNRGQNVNPNGAPQNHHPNHGYSQQNNQYQGNGYNGQNPQYNNMNNQRYRGPKEIMDKNPQSGNNQNF